MSVRADNYLRELDRPYGAASLIPICPEGDEAAGEVASVLFDRGINTQVVNGMLCARVGDGDTIAVYEPAPAAAQRWINYTTLMNVLDPAKYAAVMGGLRAMATSGLPNIPAEFMAGVLKAIESETGLDIRSAKAQALLGALAPALGITEAELAAIMA
jgi:hypothetical protein